MLARHAVGCGPLTQPPLTSQPVFPTATDLAGARRNERRFKALTDAFSDVVWLADPQGRLVSDLPRFRAVSGQSIAELLGEGWLTGLHPDDRGRAVERWTAARATASPYAVEYRIVGPGGERWFDVRGAPVRDDDGTILEWVGTAVDTTERHEAEAARQELAGALQEKRQVLEQVIAQAPQAVAVLLGPEHEFWFYNDAFLEIVPPGRVRAGIEMAAALPEAMVVARPLLDRAFAGEEVRIDSMVVPFDGPGSFNGERHYRGAYTPLRVDGTSIGVLVFATEVTEEVRARDDLEARLRQERRIASSLQEALLPDALVPIPGLDAAAVYLTARQDVEVGGDWYDTTTLADGRVLISIGDISGHGLHAATEMSQVRAAIRAHAITGGGPDQVLARTAEFVQALGLSDMISAVVAILDPATGELAISSAAHLPVLLLGGRGAAELLDVPANLPLGLLAQVVPPTRLILEEGQALALYTDGLVEQPGRSLVETLEELRRHAARAPLEHARAVAEHLGAFESGRAADADDAAILVVRRVGPDRLLRHSERWEAPATPEHASRVRRAAVAFVAEHGGAAAPVEGLRLALAEAINNAVLHAFADVAPGTLHVLVDVDHGAREVRAVVRDDGIGLQPRSDSPGMGLGLPLMASTADDFEIATAPGGTGTQITMTFAFMPPG